jgi:hypothetical protein
MPRRSATLAQIANEVELGRLRSGLRESQRKIGALQEALEQSHIRLDVALALSRRRKIKPIAAKSTARGESCAVALAGDWHFEERVESRAVNGKNEFDLAIAERRAKRFFQSLLELVELQRHGTDIRTLCLPLLGDFITGYIHEELQESNQLSPTQTVLKVSEILASGIELLRRSGGFDRIVIPCVVGNHGRTTQKQRVSTGYKNSYEWLLYHMLAQRITDGVEWDIANGLHLYQQVYDQTLRIHHGDSIRYQGGVGGISIPVNKAISAWDRVQRADLDLFGHWHQQKQDRKWICNGSLIGYSPYALSIKADFEPPSQTFFLLHSTRGRTITAPIFLEES